MTSVFSNLARNRTPAATPAAESSVAAQATPACPGCVFATQTASTDVPQNAAAVVSVAVATVNGAAAPAERTELAAPPAEVTVDTALLVPTNPVTLAVITNHDNPQFAAILAGVVGRVKGEGFTIDPIYKQISYLFSLADGTHATAGTHLKEITLPNEAAANEYVINAIKSSGQSWDQMYAQFSGNMPGGDMGKHMIEAEKAQVHQATLRVIEAAGLTSYSVPVTYEAFVDQDADRAAATTVAQLAASASVATATITPATGEGVVIAPTAEQPEQALTDVVRDHPGGMALTLTGMAEVLASSPEHAKVIMDTLLSVSNQGGLRNVLTLTPVSINNADLIPYEADNDYERE